MAQALSITNFANGIGTYTCNADGTAQYLTTDGMELTTPSPVIECAGFFAGGGSGGGGGGTPIPVYGCTNPLASNYDVRATIDDGTCANIRPQTVTVTLSRKLGFFGVPTVEIQNVEVNTTVILTTPFIPGWIPVRWETELGGQTFPLAQYGFYSISLDVAYSPRVISVLYGPDATTQTPTVTPAPSPVPKIVLGCTDPESANYNSLANQDDGSCISIVVYGCTTPLAQNYDPRANTDDGSCIPAPPPPSGCTNPRSINYDPNAVIDDGTCIAPPVYGCTNPAATNYKSDATVDDGSCNVIPPPVPGCTDPLAPNYSPLATVNDGSCQPPIVYGCTDPAAANYNSSATVDNGTCVVVPPPIPGCMNPQANNYNPRATVDDGTCVIIAPPVLGCTNPSAVNYNPRATIDDNTCIAPPPPVTAPPPPPPPIVWRSCIDGSTSTGLPPTGYQQSQYLGAGGGECWEPAGTIGFTPSLNSIVFTHQRGSSLFPASYTFSAENPSYSLSYRVNIVTDPTLFVVTPASLLIPPRTSQTFTVGINPQQIDTFGDGQTAYALQVEIVQI